MSKKDDSTENKFLYLNLVTGSDNKSSYHIGLSTDINSRMRSYRGCHNKSGLKKIKLVKNSCDELAYQLYFKKEFDRGIDGIESFVKKDDLLDKFDNIEERDVYESLFKERNDYFSPDIIELKKNTRIFRVLMKSIGLIGVDNVLNVLGDSTLDCIIKRFITKFKELLPDNSLLNLILISTKKERISVLNNINNRKIKLGIIKRLYKDSEVSEVIKTIL